MCHELQKIPNIFFEKPEAGLLIWCQLPKNINEKQLFYRAEKNGLLIMPGYLFYPYGNHGENHFRLSFSDVTDQEIIEGISILKKTLLECQTEAEA